MAKDFWFKFYFKDWANDVKPLSMESRGLLIELIIHMRQLPIPGRMKIDFRLTERLTGMPTEKIKFAFDEFKQFGIFDFENNAGDEYIVSRKITNEHARSLVNKANGSLGGNPNLKKNKKNRLTGSVKPKVNRTPNSIFNSNSLSNSLNVSFEDFWILYDKAKGKKACIPKWEKLTDSDRENIMIHLPRYKEECPDKIYRQHPETYLNNRTWEDEVIIPKSESDAKKSLYDTKF